MSKERKNCMCTAMLYDPAEKQKHEEDKFKKIAHKATLLERIESALKLRSTKILTLIGATALIHKLFDN